EHIPVYPVHTTAERLDQLELHIVHVGEREAQVHLPLLAEHFRGKLLFHHQKLRHFVEIPELVKAVVQILCYPGYLHDIAERQARCDRHFVLRSASPTSTRGRAAMVSPLSAPNLTVWRSRRVPHLAMLASVMGGWSGFSARLVTPHGPGSTPL